MKASRCVLSGTVLQGWFHFPIMLLALFFFAKLATHLLIAAERLFNEPGVRLASTIADSVCATVNGTAVAALGRGFFMGIAYVICDVPHPPLFAGLTVASAMVRLGAWISIDRRCVDAAWLWRELACKRRAARNRSDCTMIGDNVVLLALIGEAAKLPFLLVLIGMLGGLQSFGWIVFSLDRSLWQWSLRCGANGWPIADDAEPQKEGPRKRPKSGRKLREETPKQGDSGGCHCIGR